jgi:hypothetical protein
MSAATTLRDYRYQINFSDTPADDGGPNDARLIDLFSFEEVSAELFDAAAR